MPRFSPSFRSAGVLPVLVLAASLWGPTAPASAQDADQAALTDRLDRLERDIRMLNIQVARGAGAAAEAAAGEAAEGAAKGGGAMAPGPMSGPALARIDVRISALEEEVRDLTGKVEQSAFRFDQIEQRLDKMSADLEYRLGALEGRPGGMRPGAAQGMAGSPGGAPAPMNAVPRPPAVSAEGEGTTIISRAGEQAPVDTSPRTLGTIKQSELTPPPQAVRTPAAEGEAGTASAEAAAGSSALPAGSPREQYAHAFGLLRRAEYDQAEAALTAFMEAHPDDPLAVNARYWLGETFYVRGDYVRAAETFLKGYQETPTGPKAPDTLLKLGMSLGNLDKSAQACATFGKLTKEFPEVSQVIQRKVEAQRAKYGCK